MNVKQIGNRGLAENVKYWIAIIFATIFFQSLLHDIQGSPLTEEGICRPAGAGERVAGDCDMGMSADAEETGAHDARG